MLGAKVPEASVDEDCDPSRPPTDVHAETLTGDGAEVHSISDPRGMENASDGYLASRIPPPLPLHVSSDDR